MTAYCALVQGSTGCIPNLLFVGGEMALMLDLMVDKQPVNGQDPPSCPVEYVESNGFGRLVRWRSSLLVRIYKLVWFDRNDCMTHNQTLGLTKLGIGTACQAKIR